MKGFLAGLVAAILALALGASIEMAKGQSVQSKPPAPSVYIPSEVQLLRLQVKQRDALLAQQELGRAQAQFQQALLSLNAEADKVKLDNKWPATLTFDPGTVTFNEPPAAAAPAPAAPATPAPAPKPTADVPTKPAAEAKKP